MEGRPARNLRRIVPMLLPLALVPGIVLAQVDAEDQVCGFLDSIGGLLNTASAAVVTIAIIFAGYQIAFAHKRISDVAPILVGGMMIGAAGQIARMVLGPEAGECTAMAMQAMQVFHA